MMDGAASRDMLLALLPPGPAWPRDEDSNLAGLLHAAGDGMARLEGRAFALLEEADPLTTLEMLPDWERALGLPDPCTPISTETRDRQLAIARKLAGIGGQTRVFFVELAALLGLEIEIIEPGPFVAGSRVGEELNDDDWRFAWIVRTLPGSASAEDEGLQRLGYFTAGNGLAGDRLRSFGSANLECLISRARPAHSEVIFAYEIDPEPMLWFDFLNP